MSCWPRALLGGFAGTAAMTVVLAAERALVPDAGGPVDYDASEHVVIAAANLVGRRPPRSAAARGAVFAVVHWGYGSAVALAFPLLRRLVRSDLEATLAFYAGCQTMTLVLFPTLGETPPPWRWTRGQLVSSFGVHALYAASVAGVIRGRRGGRDVARTVRSPRRSA